MKIITSLVQEIVEKAKNLKDKYIDQKDIPVNWACIFSQNENEYDKLNNSVSRIGKIIKQTPTGNIFHITPIHTIAGDLLLLKIRKPDSMRPEIGDADFTVNNYSSFKEKYVDGKRFKLIIRPDFEMIELMEDGCDVRCYFSNPTQKELLKISKVKV